MDVHDSDNNTQEMKNIKSQYEDEFLVKVGAKKEEIDWHPMIVSRRTERPKSSYSSISYPTDFRLGRPKTARSSLNRNPWSCGDQALRQMTMITKYGPRRVFFYNRHVSNVLTVHDDDNSIDEQGLGIEEDNK